MIQRTLDVATSLGATFARFGSGAFTGRLGGRPAQPLELFDFEGCPFCRKVREALSMLDLDAHVRPCPKNGRRYRAQLVERAGKEQFPYLADPNTGKELYESDAIVAYLYETYGAGAAPLLLRAGPLGDLSAASVALWRGSAGVRYRAARAPERELEMYSFEASPYCRIAREALSSLELPYLLHNVARGSPRRGAFVERSGKMQVPWLADPNTGVEMFESADIVRYLDQTYALT